MYRRAKKPIIVGNVKILVEYRTSTWDQGAVIRVFTLEGCERQVLKFDPFTNDPHFHLDPDGKNVIRTIESGNPVDWSLQQISEHLSELFAESGFEKAAANLNKEEVHEVLPEIKAALKSVMPSL